MFKKLEYKYIKEKIEEYGCVLLTSEDEFNNEKISQNKMNSQIKLKIKCKCKDKNLFYVSYNSFQRGQKQCVKCGRSNMGKKHELDYLSIKNFIENNKCKLLTTFDEFELLKSIQNKSNTKVKLYMLCKCNNKFFTSYDLFKNKNVRQCKSCGYNKVKIKNSITHNEFISRVYSLVKDEYKVLGIYKGSRTPIQIKHICDKCDNYEWNVDPNGFLQGSRCPKCYGNILKSTKEFKEEIYNIVNEEYEVLDEYKNAHIPLSFKHNKCKYKNNIFLMSPNSFLQGQRCPYCNESKGENKINNYLINKNIKFYKQYKFNDCKNERMLSFDFYLPNYNICIEFQGIQHYKPVDFFGGSKTYITQQYNDNIKRKYCKNKNIKLIEISYLDIENIELILNNILM